MHFLRVFFLLPLLLTATSVLAESVNIFSLDFEVDELSPVNGRGIRVSVNGVTKIVASKRLKPFILENYLDRYDWQQLYSIDELLNFLKEALSERADKVVGLTLAALLSDKRTNHDQLLDVVNEVTALEDNIKILRVCMEQLEGSSLKSSDALNSLILSTAIKDPAWSRGHLVPLVYRINEPLWHYMTRQYLQALMNARLREATKIISATGLIYGKGSKRFEHLKIWHTKADKVFEEVSKNNLAGLMPLVELLRNDPPLSRALHPHIAKVFHQKAEAALKSGDIDGAFQILSRINFEQRTPTTHRLIQDALIALKPSGRPVILDYQVKTLLKTVSENDELVKASFIKFLEEQIRFLLSKRRFAEIDYFMRQLLNLRPDPSVLNDDLRVEQAAALYRAKQKKQADAEIQQLRSTMSASSRLRLLFSGYYGAVKWLFMIIFILSLLCIFIYIKRIFLSEEQREEEAPEKEGFARREKTEIKDEEKTTETKGGFSYLARRMAATPYRSEYESLLRYFNLQRDADIRAIKGAYRDAIKEVHPDLHQNSEDPEGDAARFMELKQHYERILVLRKKMGFVE